MKKTHLKTVVTSNGSKKPLLIAHRGARREAPENTIPAFERAIELGCDGVEFDVVLTKDRVPLVTHNNDLSILTHHEGMVHETPFSTIKSLDFGSHFRPSFSKIKVPTLTEVLELLQPYNLHIICEIKSQPGMDFHAAQLVGGIISDFKFRRPINVSSADLMILYHLKRLSPHIERSVIIRKNSFSFLKSDVFAKFLNISEVHASLKVATLRLVERMHQKSRKVSVWTVNKPQEIDRLVAWGVDSIITDDIGMARSYLDLKK